MKKLTVLISLTLVLCLAFGLSAALAAEPKRGGTLTIIHNSPIPHLNNAIRLEPREDAQGPEEGKKLRPRDLQKVVYDPDICIGCGVCVHKCPTGSIRLVKSDVEENIPESFSEAGARMLRERGRDLSKIF